MRIEVNTDDTPTDTSIGLINGVFEWFLGGSFPDISPYNAGKDILARDGISPISKSVKVERFGDIANSSGLTISIKNTDIFWKKFLLAFGDNVSLHGSKCFIIEWSNGVFQKSIFAGTCDLPSFDKSTYNIPVRSSQDVRDSLLSGTITEDFKKSDNANLDIQTYTDSEAIGDNLPITIGENSKTFFLQTGDREEILPIVTDTETNYVAKWISGQYNNFVLQVTTEPIGLDLTNFNALVSEGFLYLRCIQGAQNGNIARVTSLTQGTFPNAGEFTIVLERNFDTEANTGGDIDLYQFVDIRKEYNSDFWKCEGFVNSDGNAITSNAEVFSYDQGYKQLPRFSIDINQAQLNDNELIVNEAIFESDSDGVLGFEITQPINIRIRNNSTYLDGSGWSYDNTLDLYSKGSYGLQVKNQDSQGDVRTEDGSNPWEYSSNLAGVNLTEFARVYEYNINENLVSSIPESFDNAYLLVNFTQIASSTGNASCTCKFQVKTDKWYGDIQEVISFNESFSNPTSANIQFNNFAENYSQNGLSDNNFWGDAFGDYDGYKLIDLGVTNKTDLLKFNKLLLVFYWAMNQGTLTNTQQIDLGIEQVGIVYRRKTDIDKGLYTSFRGRLYDTDITFPLSGLEWQSNDLIKDPLGALAHTKLLQNYSNFGINAPASGWGKAYSSVSPDSLLELTLDADGTYVSSELDTLGWYGVEISTQITKNVSSKAISKDICNRFFLISWIGDNFKEKVCQVAQKTTFKGLEQVTQLDMLSWGSRIEQDSRNIFCEPYVNYDYDVGSGKFNKSMAITNTGSDLTTEQEKADAVKGLDYLSNSAKAVLWDRARALYLYYNVVNDPPKILTDHTWISSDVSAYWYIRKWLSFMGASTGINPNVVPKNKFNFEVTYEKGKSWDIGTRLNVKLPNITDDVFYEFLITSITKNVSSEFPSIEVSGILFDLDVRVDNTIQDSFDDSLENWQDTTNPANENIRDEV